MSIKYLENSQVASLIQQGKTYQKSALTGLKKLKFQTFVKDGDSVRMESECFLPGCVIARNPGVIGTDKQGNDIYNEWPISIETAVKNYGQEVVDSLTDDFTYHKKKATLQAIELTQEILNILGVQGDTLEISVSWSDQPMLAKIGDYLSSGGYSVSAHDMQGYELV